MKLIPDNGDGVVILGAAGTLGQQLGLVFPNALLLDRAELDVTDYAAVRAKLSSISDLSAVLNCVAYNDVDGAETNRDIAMKLNAEVPAKLAELCKELDVTLVHYSTGFVFDGTKDTYSEDDQTAPLSVYAESKAAGEQAVINSGAAYYLIRTNVLFGPKGASEASKPAFVDIMMNVAKKTNVIKVVDDETYSITYAPDLARSTKELLTGGQETGIYHIVNSGYASWYGLATELFTDLGFSIKTENPGEGSDTTPDGKNITLLPVPGTEFPRPAKRPARVVLNNTKLPALRSWQEALQEYLANLPT
jgi:dTDP-4-dehydrorhamnose reductase